MDEEMEDVFEGRFSPVEIDFEYELRYRNFDFSLKETLAEAREVEL